MHGALPNRYYVHAVCERDMDFDFYVEAHTEAEAREKAEATPHVVQVADVIRQIPRPLDDTPYAEINDGLVDIPF